MGIEEHLRRPRWGVFWIAGYCYVVPDNDLILHEINEQADCVCGPKMELLQSEQDGDAWMIVHEALDGRA